MERGSLPAPAVRQAVLFVARPGRERSVPCGVVVVSTAADAVAELRQRRFSVLVVELAAANESQIRRLSRLDPEMYILVAAEESSLPLVGPVARECQADGVVRLPIDRRELSSAVDRASRVGSRVADCVKLYELCRALFGTLKQRDLVRTVLDIAPRAVPCESAALFLLGTFCESPAAFECHASESPSPELRCLLAEVSGLISRRGASLSNDEVADGRAANVGWRWLGCPLPRADALGGAIVFLRRSDDDPFSQHERQAASMFAENVASALENASDYRELETKYMALTHERHRAMAREAVAIARDLGGAIAHEVTNAMTAVTTNVDALAEAAQDQELWKVAKEAAEYLLLQGEPTGQRLATRIMDAGGVRNADGLVTEIAAMIDECLEGVRRVSEMARGLTAARNLPPRTPSSDIDMGELLRGPVVTRALVNRTILLQSRGVPALVAARLDVEQAIAHVLRALDRNGPPDSAGAMPLLARIEERLGACVVTIEDPTPTPLDGGLQSMLTPRLRVHSGNVYRFDASFAFAHALLARNGLDLWVEARDGGGVSFVISAASSAA